MFRNLLVGIIVTFLGAGLSKFSRILKTISNSLFALQEKTLSIGLLVVSDLAFKKKIS
jgi:hypothetical protein